ncbi:MAG: MFS transporter [Ruminococcaceae bacterium]|nr:MFS transporter [Oscillospiraceae bacterium]
MNKNIYKRTICASFLTGGSMAVASILSPLLFTTFNRQYDISYTMLGFLIVLNFGVQLLLDLIYSFLSKRIDLKTSVKSTPFIMFSGLVIYALSPMIFPGNIYAGLCIGTIIFSAGCGLAEVLISPVIAAIPSDNPQSLMSKLHSCYAWGVVLVVAFSSLFFYLFGYENWQILTLILSVFPFIAFLIMIKSEIPDIESKEKATGSDGLLKNKTAILYILGIFFAGASEITMSQWCSGYLEVSFNINKTVGDLLGLALFGFTLGIGRTLYSKIGKNIDRVLFWGCFGTFVCYIVATFSSHPIPALMACALTGFTTSMLWPGSLIAVEKRIPNPGVGLYALMATGGDLGATLFPQGVGYLIDRLMGSDAVMEFAKNTGIGIEQLSMRGGMLFSSIAPILGTILFYILMNSKKENSKSV